MRVFVVVALCLLPSLAAGKDLTLKEALSLALQQNPALAAARADLAIADGHILEAAGLDDFLLEAGTSWYETRRDPTSGVPVQQLSQDLLDASAAVSRPLASGGRIGLRLGHTLSHTLFGTATESGLVLSTADLYQPTLQLTFSHPLLRGIGRRTARAPRYRARARRDVASLELELAAATLVRDVQQAYWELSYAASEVKIRDVAEHAAVQQLAVVQAQIDVGKQPRTAAAEVELTIALRKDERLDAEALLETSAIELRRLVGLPITPEPLSPVDAPPVAAEPPPLDQALAQAMDHSPQLAAVRAQAGVAAIEVDVSKNGLLPQLDFSFAGGPLGNAETVGLAARQMATFASYQVGAGLVFSHPVQRRAARGALEAAQRGLERARLSANDMERQIVAGVARGRTLVLSAEARVATLTPTVSLAELDLEAEAARFAVGRSSNFDVLRRQVNVATARLRLLRAQIDALRAVAALSVLTGS